MSRSTFSGPVLSGTVKYNAYKNVGNSLLLQNSTLVQNSTNVVNATDYFPAGSQLLNITVDVLTAFDSATSAALTIGVSSGDTTYVTTINAKTAGRASYTFTAAQLLAMSSLVQDNTATAAAGQPTSTIVTTITPVGATTTGTVLVTFQYAQFDDRSTGSAV